MRKKLKKYAESEDVAGAFTDDNFCLAVRVILNLGENEPIIRSACAAAQNWM